MIGAAAAAVVVAATTFCVYSYCSLEWSTHNGPQKYCNCNWFCVWVCILCGAGCIFPAQNYSFQWIRCFRIFIIRMSISILRRIILFLTLNVKWKNNASAEFLCPETMDFVDLPVQLHWPLLHIYTRVHVNLHCVVWVYTTQTTHSTDWERLRVNAVFRRKKKPHHEESVLNTKSQQRLFVPHYYLSHRYLSHLVKSVSSSDWSLLSYVQQNYRVSYHGHCRQPTVKCKCSCTIAPDTRKCLPSYILSPRILFVPHIFTAHNSLLISEKKKMYPLPERTVYHLSSSFIVCSFMLPFVSLSIIF